MYSKYYFARKKYPRTHSQLNCTPLGSSQPSTHVNSHAHAVCCSGLVTAQVLLLGATIHGGGGDGGRGGGAHIGGGAGEEITRMVQQWPPLHPAEPEPHSTGELAKPSLQHAP